MRDDQIRDLLRTLEEDRVPDPAFADDLHATLAGMSHRRARRWPLVVLAAAAVLALAGGAALGSGLIDLPMTAEATPTPSPSSTSAATTPPSPTPSPAATATLSATGTPSAAAEATPSVTPAALDPPDDRLPVGSRVEVTVEALRIREGPSTDASTVTTVPRGEILYVQHWNFPGRPISPVIAEGFDWYEVQYIAGHREWPELPPTWQDDRIRGYVAARSDDAWLVGLLEPRCPETVNIETLTAITPWERLACVGSAGVTVEGAYGCGVCDSLVWRGIYEPSWLASYLSPIMSVLSPPGRVQEPGVSPIVAVVPPDGVALTHEHRGSILRVTGHFNDPRSADCVIGVGPPGDEELADQVGAEWYCRELFVVDAWELVGPDPDYPTPPP